MSEAKWLTLWIAALLAVLAALMGAGYALSEVECDSQWKYSGYRARYEGLIAGCLVESSPGRWVPSKAMREVAP